MNKGELIDKIAKDAKISKVQASNALNSALDGVESTLKKGNKVTLGWIRHLFGQLAKSEDRSKSSDRSSV